MPPLWRYWLVYALFGFIVAGLGLLVYFLGNWPDSIEAQPGPNSFILLGGVVVAVLGLLASAWTQWRTSATAHALDALQTLRTDREYLINAQKVNKTAKIGTPLSHELRVRFDYKSEDSTVDAPSFRDASLFVLNQYEFLAAGVRSGAIDLLLVKETLHGPIRALMKTYAAPIRDFRRGRWVTTSDGDPAARKWVKGNPAIYRNLIWLYQRLEGRVGDLDLGPVL